MILAMHEKINQMENTPTNKEENYLEISKVMEVQPGSKRYVCVGLYIDENGQEQLFTPKMTFSIFHGDKELVGDVDTMGFADIPVGQLPEQADAPTGINTDERGRYIFYTAVDGEKVKIYTNADMLTPENSTAYKVVHGFLPNDSVQQFSAVGMGSRSRNGELLSNKIDGKILGLLNS